MDWREALDRTGLIDALAAFDARVAGTFPLGLAVAGSDIDLLCHAPDAERLARVLWETCSHYPHFAMWQWCTEDRPVVAAFSLGDMPFEIFGQARPVEQQLGWRHFDVERRLLGLGGTAFRATIMDARRTGLKTEPAFASVLGLGGNAHEALDALADAADQRLADLLRTAGF